LSLIGPAAARRTSLRAKFPLENLPGPFEGSVSSASASMRIPLISFKGGKETARSTGVTDRAAIAKILDAAI